MTLGQLICQARQEAGLSQRQLAGEEITRNMLSALEHDTANPSVATLRYLARRLDKPVSYFLGEDVPQIPEYPALVQARQAYDSGNYRQCLELLDRMEQPGEILDREITLLKALSALALAEEMIRENRIPYAQRLLDGVEVAVDRCPYWTRGNLRQLRILQAKCDPAKASRIPPEDDALLLRCRAALELEQLGEALNYLDAAQDRRCPEWNYLRGQIHFRLGEYADAAQCFHRAEDHYDLRQSLEICYRELEDYKMAYFYARK